MRALALFFLLVGLLIYVFAPLASAGKNVKECDYLCAAENLDVASCCRNHGYTAGSCTSRGPTGKADCCASLKCFRFAFDPGLTKIFGRITCQRAEIRNSSCLGLVDECNKGLRGRKLASFRSGMWKAWLKAKPVMQRPPLAFDFFLLLLLFTSAAAGKTCSRWRTIATGDTCYKFQTEAGLSPEEFRQLNSNVNCDMLLVGEGVCLAETDASVACSRNHTVASGDTCFAIRTTSKLPERQFMELNPGLNCNALQISQTLCVEAGGSEDNQATTTPDSPTVTILPPPLPPLPRCREYYEATVSDGTCDIVAKKFRLNSSDLLTMNPYIDCQGLQVGEPVCVSLVDHCQLRYTVKAGRDSCERLKVAFNLLGNEFTRLNPRTRCNALLDGEQVCVVGVFDRELPAMHCTSVHVLRSGDDCWKLSQEYGITIDELVFLNPWADCARLPVGSEFCIQGASSVRCASFTPVRHNWTCDELRASEGISSPQLARLNPTLRCDLLAWTHQVCTGEGFFRPADCSTTHQIQNFNLTCSNLTTMARIGLDELKTLNPSLDCSSSSLPFGSYICVRGNFGAADLETAKMKLYAELSRKLSLTYVAYKKDPTAENGERYYDSLVEAISDDRIYATLKAKFASDPTTRAVVQTLTARDFNASALCEKFRNATVYSPRLRACLCAPAGQELAIRCQLLFNTELRAIFATPGPPAAGQRLKREDVEIGSPKKPKTKCELELPIGKNSKNETRHKGECFGGGCKIPVAQFLSIEGSLKFCVPAITMTRKFIKYCFDGEHDCKEADTAKDGALKQFATTVTHGEIKLCITDLTQGQLEALDNLRCFFGVYLDYFFFTGKFSVQAELTIIIASIKGGAHIKSHDMIYPDMCERDEFHCEDYCLWHYYESKNGEAYGSIEISLFKITDDIKLPVYQKRFNNPKMAGCVDPGQAGIAVRNARTCNTEMEIKCRSKEDDGEWIKVTPEQKTPYGFQFGQTKATLFWCDLRLQGAKGLISWDAFGGDREFHVWGKKAHFYAIKNDGVYYGKSNGKEDELVKDKRVLNNFVPCTPQVTPAPKPKGPTGTSSVPANTCGKRIVGYYTSWGKREVTEEQLRRLTHVIFAFVTMRADGTLMMATSDPANPDPKGEKAMRRLQGLQKKARAVNSGVRVMFAIGGWENSEHFSNVAANAELRRTFIEAICKYIKDYDVDGVDLDWEYPVTGGAHEGVPADKENYVTLVKELRTRLDALQEEMGREAKLLISIASAAGDWTIRPGYDLKNLLNVLDFVNVMTYDYYGAWESQWGAYTGPPAPLYYSTPANTSGKMNVDYTMKVYACRSHQPPKKLNMGVPFYGRFWENVGDPLPGGDPMWRKAAPVAGGRFAGGYLAWRDIGNSGWNLNAASFHEKAKAPYILAGNRFLGFENPRSLSFKITYATQKNLGGIMIWAIDLDDDSDTLLRLVSDADLCSGGDGRDLKHKCIPFEDQRWWTPENGGSNGRQGMCGRSAPLIGGFYPVCDPDDPGYSCCGKTGYCNSGKEACECDGCVDYRKNQEALVREPTKPTRPVQWYTQDAPDGKRGRCGKTAPLLNGKEAICNPDDENAYCCSNGGYCGKGKEFCECDGCVNFRK